MDRLSVIEQFAKLAQMEKRGWGVGGGELSHDGKHLVLYQSETGRRIGPEENARPYFHDDLPEGYHQRIKYTINHDNPERPAHEAMVRIPIEVASKHPGLQRHLQYAQKDWSARKTKRASDLSQRQRESLPTKAFAVPAAKAKKIGVAGEIKGEARGKYPIPDERHAKNALARVSQHGTPAERQMVRSKVYSKYPGLKEGFQERHGESPTAKENVKKVEQGGIGKKAEDALYEAFYEALEKAE